MYQLNLDIQDFLANYWQKRPLLIKGGFKDFKDPITPEELAGLAMEEEVESRLVTRFDGQWQAAHGPFASYDHLGDELWTVLVQACNHWVPEVNALAKPFEFIPGWRLDDVMVSYSTPKAGVGPHIDHYDVFITQGMGKRHWRVGEALPLNEFAAHAALLHCEPFDAIIDVIMEPGDILYIPPGFPHEGYAIEPSMNLSVGFRAPDAKTLISSFADHLIDEEVKLPLYTDPDLTACTAHGEVKARELHRLRELMQHVLDDEALFKAWFGTYISEAKHEMDVCPLEPEYSADELAAELLAGGEFARVAGLRCVWFSGERDHCYIDGEKWTLASPDSAAISLLCDRDVITCADLASLADQAGFLQLLTRLVNRGYWFSA
ncbi:MAG: JmjC domain-containing protein [Aeromonas sp.]